jgi:hypothetical protein
LFLKSLQVEIEFLNKNLDPNNLFKNFFNIFITTLNTHIPIKTIKQKHQKSFKDWSTRGIRVSQKKLFELYNLRTHGDEKLRNYVSRYSKVFKQVCQMAKKDFLSNRIIKSKNCIREVWNVIREETGKTLEKKCPFINLSGGPSDDITVETFNNFFTNIAGELTNNIEFSEKSAMKYLHVKPKLEKSFKFHPITADDLIKVCKQLKSTSSNDLWYVTSTFIGLIIQEIAPILATIFNKCILGGVFPCDLKLARVIPIYKKGNKSDPNNYRPISVLPVISKLLEKIVAEQLTIFFVENDVIHPQQYGFQKNKSTGHAMESLVSKILEAFEEGSDVCGIFCDLSKAFDCVNHSILVKKLEHYGVRSNEKKFFESYLSNKKQTTEINNTRSSCKNIKFGVPQGSILGPLLFLVYVNDLPYTISNPRDDIVMFADDTSLLVKNHKSGGHVGGDVLKVLDDANKWFEANNLVLNVTKTNAICFSLKRRPNESLHHDLAGRDLAVVDHCGFLGVIVDDKLQWTSHIDQLCKKLSSAIFAIRKVGSLCGHMTAKSVYFSYFHSLMAYGVIVWGNGGDSSRVFILQKRAVRAILGLQSRDSCRNAFSDLGILTLSGLFILESIKFAKRNINDFNLNSDFHEYETRQGHLLRPIKHRLTKVSKSFVYLSVRLYNKLPQRIKSLEGESFKREAKALLVENSLYSIDEFQKPNVCLSFYY